MHAVYAKFSVIHCQLTPQVRVTRGKLASQSVIPRPEILAKRRTPHPLKGEHNSTERWQILTPGGQW